MFDNEIGKYLEKHGLKAFAPKAVLFDMDGVLYDSEEAYKYEGMRGVETIKLLARRQWGRELADDEAAKMYEEKASAFRVCPKAQKMEGVEELMRKIKARDGQWAEKPA